MRFDFRHCGGATVCGSAGGLERFSDFSGHATAVIHLIAVLTSPCTNLFSAGTLRGAPAYPSRLPRPSQLPAFLNERPERRVQFVVVLWGEVNFVAHAIQGKPVRVDLV